MSVQAMSYVWKNSQWGGSPLLVLLALADHMNAEGFGAWTSVASIGKQTRLSERNVHYILRKLQESGELAIDVGGGPKRCNAYSLPGMVQSLHPRSGRGVQTSAVRVQSGVSKGAIAVAPESKEPRESRAVDGKVEELIDFVTWKGRRG